MTGPRRIRDLGWETYAWLIYSLPFLLTALAAPFTPFQRGVMLLSYAVFLPLYFGGYFIRTPQILWIVAAFDAIAIINSQWNPSASTFFIFASACIAPRRRSSSLHSRSSSARRRIASSAAVLSVPVCTARIVSFNR